MSCYHCETAALRLHHGLSATCAGCRAREISRSQLYWRAQRTRIQDAAYRGSLEFFGVTHQQVRDAAGVDWINVNNRGTA